MRIHRFKSPVIDESATIAESASITGEVIIGQKVNVWFGAVIRGDIAPIHVGDETNIQDRVVIHVGYDKGTWIGKKVTIGHGAILHGCTIKENVLVGMGSIVLDGAVIEKDTIVAAGSLVTQNKCFEPGVLIMGSPAKAVRKLTEDEIEKIKMSADKYLEYVKDYE